MTNQTTHIIGSRNPRIEVRTSLDGIIMSPAEIRAEEEKLAEQRARQSQKKKEKIPAAPRKDENSGEIIQPITKQGRIYVPSLDLYVSEDRILKGRDWNQQTEKLHSENKRMPTIPEFVEFLKYLRSPEGQKAVPSYQAILDEVYKVEGNWRSENLDAFFTKKKDGMYIAYHKFDSKGKIIKAEDKLETYHSKNETPGIDLSSWLNNPTKQGLPKSKIAKGDLYYWAPVSGYVARFDVDSDGADLDCGRDPAVTSDGLGVRYVEPRSGEDVRKNLGGLT